MLTLLMITVLGFGGPPGTTPSVLPNGRITLSRHNHVVATASHGRLSRRVRPGTYTVASSVPRTACQTRTVKVTHRRMHIQLRCALS